MRTDIKTGCYAWQPDDESTLKYRLHCKKCSFAVQCWADSTPDNQSEILLQHDPILYKVKGQLKIHTLPNGNR